MSNVAVVIPARLGSTRLPKKALADLAGHPMVVRTAMAASKLGGISRIIVATDSEEIKRAVEKAGFEGRLTPSELATGTERVAYVARDLNEEIIVNVQGDEPLIEPLAIQAAMDPVLKNGRRMGSAFTHFQSYEDFLKPSFVKVLVNDLGDAIYFSRFAIPYRQGPVSEAELLADPKIGRHLGIYVYEREFLLEYAGWPSPLIERAESLEQLRVLQRGISLGMGRTAHASIGVDTQEDLERVREIFRERGQV
ncbi:MAG: 3-deoxy-manno-octulosonate cytidylyltransferase [Proteobacteria bacterium]|nr:MAG: 3-deoxy-manno-octulosonate cytidylyltransferase [Pseudomonadota bacterium]